MLCVSIALLAAARDTQHALQAGTQFERCSPFFSKLKKAAKGVVTGVIDGLNPMAGGLDNAGQALLSNGHVLANMRTSNTRHTCSCRAVSVSTDGGESFGAVGSDATLISPVC